MKKRTRKAAVIVLAGVLAVTGVTGAQEVSAAKKAMALSKKKVTVEVNKSAKVTLKNKVTGAKVSWSSKNVKVAVVNKNGKITGKSEGTTKVTCKVVYKKNKKNVTKKMNVTVKVVGASASAPTTEPVNPSPSPDEKPSDSAQTPSTDAVLTAPAGYKAVYEKSAMGNTVTYNMSLNLKADNTYSYTVAFEMGGEKYENAEAGTYTAENGVVTLKSAEFVGKDSDSISGTYTADTITVTRYISAFAFSAQEITFTLDNTAGETEALATGAYAVDISWSGMGAMMSPVLSINTEDMTFQLYNSGAENKSKGNGTVSEKEGVYTLTYTDENNAGNMTTFTYADGVITFTSPMYYGVASFNNLAEDEVTFVPYTAKLI